MAESPEESPLPKGTTLRESVFFCFHFPQQPKHSCFTIMCHKWTQKIKYLKSSRFFVRNAWMWNMSWRCEFCLQIKKIHQTKKCIKFVNRSLRNHLLKSPLKGIHIHIHRCWWHRRRIIGVFFRYRRKMHKTRNTSLQNCNEKHGINCVSYSKARETPPFCGFLRNLHVVCPSHWGSSKENWL